MQNYKEKELVKNTAIITFGKICTQLVSFLLLPLYTALLNTEQYGTVDLVITYSALLLPFITLALEQAVFRFLIDVRNDFLKSKEVISNVIIFSAFQCAVMVAILIIIYTATQNNLMLYFSLVIVGNTISAISLQISRGLGDNVGYAIGSTVSAICTVVLNVIFLVVLKMGPSGMMLAIAIGNSTCGVISGIRSKLWKYCSFTYCNKHTFKELLKYSLPLIPNQFSWWALNASDKVIIQFFIGVTGNGLIAVANKFSGVYIQFSNIFNVSWTESAALHIGDDDSQSYFTSTIVSVYKLFLSVCCGIIVLMPFVFPIMVNSQYNDAYNLIPLFMLASLCNVVVSLYGVIYVAHKKTLEIAKTAIYAALVNISSHLILIKFIGIYAAAVSTLLGYGAMAVYRYFHSRKYMIIKFDVCTLLFSVALIVISVISYYNNNIMVHIISLIAVIVISTIINYSMIRSLLLMISVKMKSIR